MAKKKERSIKWIVIMSMIFVAYVGWGFMATSWPGAAVPEVAPPEGTTVRVSARGFGFALLIASILTFLVNSVTQLPNLFSVIAWQFSNQIWLPILFIILEGLIVAGGVGLVKLEAHLAAGSPAEDVPHLRQRKKKKRKRKRLRE